MCSLVLECAPAALLSPLSAAHDPAVPLEVRGMRRAAALLSARMPEPCCSRPSPCSASTHTCTPAAHIIITTNFTAITTISVTSITITITISALWLHAGVGSVRGHTTWSGGRRDSLLPPGGQSQRKWILPACCRSGWTQGLRADLAGWTLGWRAGLAGWTQGWRPDLANWTLGWRPDLAGWTLGWDANLDGWTQG